MHYYKISGLQCILGCGSIGCEGVLLVIKLSTRMCRSHMHCITILGMLVCGCMCEPN